MTVGGIQEIMDAWAPPDVAWERDNVGLQAGDPLWRVQGILVALDVTEEVVAEALRRGANLVVSHHPLLFRPLLRVTGGTARERTLAALIRRRVALFSAHTNLDFTLGGTNHALARALGVSPEGFLRTPYRLQNKIVTFVPPSHAGAVTSAMASAGAGVIGEYEECSFRGEGTGTFKRTPGAPVRRTEVRLEMIAPRRAVGSVIRALKAAHPYKEAAFDVIALENTSAGFGMGVVGTLARAVPLERFLAEVRRALKSPALRWSGGNGAPVRRVALCGGSGSELLPDAIASGADAFVTADVRYHTFQEAGEAIALADAGHYETEFPVVAAIVERLRREIHNRGARITVRAAARSTNPVRWSM